jgi:hypothetical protein
VIAEKILGFELLSEIVVGVLFEMHIVEALKYSDGSLEVITVIGFYDQNGALGDRELRGEVTGKAWRPQT